MRVFSSVMAVALAAAMPALAGEGSREGVVLGIGIGPGWTNEGLEHTHEVGRLYYASYDEPVAGFAMRFRLGFGFNDRLVLYYGGRSLITVLDLWGDGSASGATITGVGLDYYFAGERPLFAMVLAGYGETLLEGINDQVGPGVSAGFGWEFARHWSFQADAGWIIRDGIDSWTGLFTLDVLIY